jgi:His-Xaa-Ser system radical SAM maturase HxsC
MILQTKIEKIAGAAVTIAVIKGDTGPNSMSPAKSEAWIAKDRTNIVYRSLDGNTLGFRTPPELSYLSSGDIIRINQGAGEIRVLYRRTSNHNVLFFTERGNSRCLMCSQPPRDIDDSHLIDQILEAIQLMSPQTRELCITGGEPTLLGDRLFEVLNALKGSLPNTSVHMLSNGRIFRDIDYARRLSSVGHPDFVIGIPLYADVAWQHDFVVQATGAFNETIHGLFNLARFEQKLEIRFVIHRQTIDRLSATARFIGRNLPFVSRVALMGLEPIGFARTNIDALWIDPLDYQQELKNAVDELSQAGVPVKIYNHPLCAVPDSLWKYTVKSISDWKNIYAPECEHCPVRGQCGGFFASSTFKRSRAPQTFMRATQLV